VTPAVVIAGDCRDELPHLDAGFFAACVTSPPFYGCFGAAAGDLPDPRRRHAIGSGLVSDYVRDLRGVFYEVRRVLRPDGRLWLALGDMMGPDGGWQGIPWQVAHALRDSGWRVLDAIAWHSGLTAIGPNGRTHEVPEMVFAFSPGGSAHHAKCSPAWDMERPPLEPPAKFRALPESMVQRCLSASTHSGDRVLDPFAGIGTVARVAERLGRACFSIELDPHVARHAQERLATEARP
jgi:site-specific DNA-methyltransferase (cytosine-N4-specific)